jgi:DNA-binding CsgD family transcriptional regulator/tetratricopeptide (TPR) repeat protein
VERVRIHEGSGPVVAASDPSVGRGHLVGRDAELREITALVAPPSGAGATLVVEGVAGIGKSALWEAVLADAAGATVLACAPTEAESSLPFAGLVDLLSEVGDTDLAALPDPQQRALRAALLRDPPPAGGIEPLAVGVGCLGVLTALAQRGPVLLAVDDAQWLDPATTSAVAFALRRTGTHPVSSLFTVRRGLPLSPDLEDTFRSREADRWVLGPLDLEELDALIRLRLDQQLPLAALLQLQRASHGNPLHALEIARAADHAVAELVPGQPLPVPAHLADLLRSRLARLSTSSREGLAVLAAVARPGRKLLLAALGERAAERCLEEAAGAGVLTSVGDRVAFSHPLLREVLEEDLALDQRRAIHGRLAELVDDPVEQGRHLAAATDAADPQVAAAVEEAARLADRRGAPVEAASLTAEALRLTGGEGSDLVLRRALALATFLTRAGAFERARATLETHLGRLPPGPTRVPFLLSLATVADALGQLDAADEYLRQAIDEAQDDAAASASAKQAAAWSLAAMGEAKGAHDLARASVTDAERTEDGRVLAGAIATDGMVRFMLALGPQREAFDRAIALDPDPRSDGLSGVTQELSPTFLATNHAVWSDDVEHARTLLSGVRTWCDERADVAGLTHCDWLETILDLRHGRWQAALARSRSLERGLQWLGDVGVNAPMMRWIRALVEAHLGQVDQATRHAHDGLTSAERLGHEFARLQCEGVLGFLELSRGDGRAASTRLAPLPVRLHELGYREPAFQRLTADAVEAAVAAGELHLAAELLDRFAAAAASSGNRWGEAVVLRCRGLLQAARGEASRAADTLAAAVDRQEGLAQPFELGRTLLVQGALHRRRKQKAAAREALGRSHAIMAALPAPLWRRRAEHELARLGGRPSSPTALTATESQVAALVAAGRTNREVAAELFLRPKTVEWNLSKVYRKLGVRSRSELAAVWSPDGTDAD